MFDVKAARQHAHKLHTAFNGCDTGARADAKWIVAACDRIEALERENAALTDVMHWAQAVLTAWNVGALTQESLLHKKLRQVMIEYRMKRDALAPATSKETP